jgi:shikimate dehydrogenase
MAWRFGLLGQGIGYSLSPRIFEWFFRVTNLNGTYLLRDVPREALKSVLAEREWDGLNVTVPFKADVMAYCEEFSERAQNAAAVNTLSYTDGHLRGENTDGEGFAAALRILAGENPRLSRALIVGSGGAARACAAVLLSYATIDEIVFVSRSPDAARRAMPNLLQTVAIMAPEAAAKTFSDFDLVVQATPVGSVNMPGTPLPPPFAFRKSALVMDMIYAPRETEFLRVAKRNGAHVMNGLPMLIAQAAASFTLWTGAEISVEKAMTELLPLLEAA